MAGGVLTSTRCLLCKLLKKDLQGLIDQIQSIADKLFPIKLEIDTLINGWIASTTEALQAEIDSLTSILDNFLFMVENKNDFGSDFDDFVKNCPYVKNSPAVSKVFKQIQNADNTYTYAPDWRIAAAFLSSPLASNAVGPNATLPAILECIDGQFTLPEIDLALKIPLLRVSFGSIDIDLVGILDDLIGCLEALCNYDGSFWRDEVVSILGDIGLSYSVKSFNDIANNGEPIIVKETDIIFTGASLYPSIGDGTNQISAANFALLQGIQDKVERVYNSMLNSMYDLSGSNQQIRSLMDPCVFKLPAG